MMKLLILLRRLGRIWTLIKMLTQDEPELNLNKTTLRFNTEGDLLIKVNRALVVDSALTFLNSEERFVQEAIQAYEAGPFDYHDFLNKMAVEAETESDGLTYIDSCTGDCVNCSEDCISG